LLTPLVLARLLESQRNQKGAEEVLKQASEEHGSRTEPLFALAGFYVRARRLADAEEVFKKIQVVDPKNPTSRAALGEFFAATGRHDAAEKEFQRIVAENPGDTLSWHQLAEIEITLNRRDDARRIANDLLKKDAKDWQALTLLGRLDLEEGKTAQAEQELDQAKTANPESAVAYFQLARVYLVQGKADLAKSALNQSLCTVTVTGPIILLLVTLASRLMAADEPVSFTREVSPLLARKCVTCHNAEKNKGKFRLDTFENLLKPGSSKDPSIVPAKPDESRLFTILLEKDPDDRMPQKDDPLPFLTPGGALR